MSNDNTQEKEFDKKYLELQSKYGREPTKAEIITSLNITDDEYNYWTTAFEANKIQSLDSVYDDFSILFASRE